MISPTLDSLLALVGANNSQKTNFPRPSALCGRAPGGISAQL